MERELLRILTAVKDKTGIEVQAISDNGVHYASTKSTFIPIKQEDFARESSVFSDGEYTYFKFNYLTDKFLGLIDGCGVHANNYAQLIMGFIEMSQTKNSHLSFDEEVNLIVTGNSTKSRTLHFMNKYSTPKTPCYVFYIKCNENRAVEVQEFLRSYYGETSIVVTLSPDSVVYVKHVDTEELVDLMTPCKQAETFKRSIFEELGINVIVYVGGTVKSFTDIAVSFNQALATEKMSEVFAFSGGVLAYKDVMLAKILEDNSPAKIREYYSALISGFEEELLSDEELMQTGDAFLSNNLNVSETAREMYIHRNTLIYRIDKIERLTGLDIRKFSDALNFRILFILSKLKG